MKKSKRESEADYYRKEISKELKNNDKFICCFLNKKGKAAYIFNENINSYEIVGLLDSVKHSILSRMREECHKKEEKDV